MFFMSLVSLIINLCSVGKMTKDLNCVVLFFADFYVFYDLKTRRLVGLGRLQNRVC